MRLHTAVIAAAVLATSNMALAQDVEDYSETIELFRGIPQVAPYFGSAYGYAVWERIGRGGLGIGGATGRGPGLRRRKSHGLQPRLGHHVRRSGRRSGVPADHLLREQRRVRQVHDRQIRVRRFGVRRCGHGERTGLRGHDGHVGDGGCGQPSTGAGAGYQGGMQTFTMAEGGLMYAATIGGQKYNFNAVN